MLKFNDKKVYVTSIMLLLVAIFLWNQVLAQPENENLIVNFYNVGQGDAIHIRGSNNQDILIDGGPDSKIIEKLDQNIPFQDNTIELMILTHAHADHITGLVHVLNKYRVEQILYTDADYDSEVFSEWKRIIKEKSIEEKIAQYGQIIKFNKANLYILFPDISYNGKQVKNLNNTSIASKLVYGNSSFLFTGDAEKEEETILVNKFEGSSVLDSDLLKIGHHGSNTATTKEFLAQVSPMYAVISAGKNNKFKHPHLETLSKISDLDIKLFRTDEDDDVKCVLDGENIECN